jgi:hypothetical protein
MSKRNDQADHYFVSIEVKEHIVLMPSYIGQIQKGIWRHLNNNIMKYIPGLNGVMISYSNPVILQESGVIMDERPQIHFNVKYTACMFQPPMGCILEADITRISDGYLTCLCKGCFSIYISIDNQRNMSNMSVGNKVLVRILRPSLSGGDMLLIGELVDDKEDSDKSCSINVNGRRKKRRKQSDESAVNGISVSSKAKKRKLTDYSEPSKSNDANSGGLSSLANKRDVPIRKRIKKEPE